MSSCFERGNSRRGQEICSMREQFVTKSIQFCHFDWGLVRRCRWSDVLVENELFPRANALVSVSNRCRIDPTALHICGDARFQGNRCKLQRTLPKKKKTVIMTFLPTYPPWPSLASIRQEKSTVSTVTWSLVCCDASMFRQRLRNSFGLELNIATVYWYDRTEIE